MTKSQAHRFIVERTRMLARAIPLEEWPSEPWEIARFYEEHEYRLEPDQLRERWAAWRALYSRLEALDMSGATEQ